MYAYLYDSFTNQGKYGKLLYKIEKRLTDLNLNGKIIRLDVSKNVRVAVEDEIRLGTKTIVAVGDDHTVAQVVSAIAGNKNDDRQQITLGIIPLDEKNNKLAKLFGITSIGAACEILLARRLKTFQLAQINQDFFLFKTVLSATKTLLEIDKNYLVQNSEPSTVEISNSPDWTVNSSAENKLKMRVSNKQGESLFFFKELLVTTKDILIKTDEALDVKSPARIKLSQEKIKVIVGKDRTIQ